MIPKAEWLTLTTYLRAMNLKIQMQDWMYELGANDVLGWFKEGAD